MRLSARSLDSKLFLDLLGKPYAKGARGPGSYDCLGLAMEIARRIGKVVPAYVSDEATLHAELGAGGATLADMPQIARPIPGCIVLLRMRPDQHHIAFMVDAFRMIHCSVRVGVAIERIFSPAWERRIVGFYDLEAAK